MTEAEWWSCADPVPMVEHLGARLTDRKLRLCACARARGLWQHLSDDRSKQAIETAERFADGQAAPGELLQAFREADQAWEAIPDYTGSRRALRRSTRGRLTDRRAAEAARTAADPDLHRARIMYGKTKAQLRLADILRELFGPQPFRPVEVDLQQSAGPGSTIRAMAEAIQMDWATNHLPVLADALEDAGCLSAEALDHLRGPGPHVRGCWALDLILGQG